MTENAAAALPPDTRRLELEKNYAAFQEQLPNLLAGQRGKFALMRDGAIVEFFDTARDAFAAGQKIFGPATPFSVQEVIDTPVNLGFFSYAVSNR